MALGPGGLDGVGEQEEDEVGVERGARAGGLGEAQRAAREQVAERLRAAAAAMHADGPAPAAHPLGDAREELGERQRVGLVFLLFAYAIQPAWTEGHAFTVAQEVTDPEPTRWFVTVADGAPIAVGEREPDDPADATVTMSRAAFDRLVRDEPATGGELPVIRGDRAAVAALKGWTDRAQGR